MSMKSLLQVRLSKHVLSAQDTGSFLAISLGTVLVQVKRNFDKFMQLQLKSIEDARSVNYFFLVLLNGSDYILIKYFI